MVGHAFYVTAVMAFVRAVYRAREANCFSDIEKTTLAISIHFYPFCHKQT